MMFAWYFVNSLGESTTLSVFPFLICTNLPVVSGGIMRDWVTAL
jgi:hypothetical protein